ncbi:hypothetical protein [Streptomyces flavidovirens]|uniref:hypothetical protein n=1 Tax=Streptomyces flavidovirens TaxID=67298 RepID=UPI00040C021D|nr:hypothetical protein [Streptomyces flavidovirens]
MIAENSAIFTALLWHTSALVLVAVAVYASGLVPLPRPTADTGAWLLWKLPWQAVLLTVLVAVFGRLETRGMRRSDLTSRSWWTPRALGRPRPHAAATTVGYAACVLCLLGVVDAGPADHGPFGLPTAALGGFLAGAALPPARAASDCRAG